MRLRHAAALLGCMLLLWTAAPALADGPQGGTSAASTNKDTGPVASPSESIQLGPPPLAATSITLVSSQPGSVAVCRDFTSTSNSDPSTACAGHLGVLDWFSAATATPASLNQLQSQTQLDSAPPSGIVGVAASRAASAPAAAPRTANIASQPLSFQAPVSFQGPAQAEAAEPPLTAPQESVSGPESSPVPSPESPYTVSPEPSSSVAPSLEPTAPSEAVPPPEAASPPTPEPQPEPTSITSAAGVTPPADCHSFTGGPCVTLCSDGEWSSSSGGSACSGRGGAAAPQQSTEVTPPVPMPGPENVATTGSSGASNGADPDAASSPDSPRTAQCKDGSFSYSPDQSTACLQHGGIEKWLGSP
jgi:hypothetical protein